MKDGTGPEPKKARLLRNRLRTVLLGASLDQMVSIGRVVLAGFALFATLLDPAQPARFADFGYDLMGFYFLLSAILAVISIFHPERRAAIPPFVMHVIDILIISALLFLTDGPTSPFFAFFTFILLAAALRWQWRSVLATGACMVVIFVIIGVADTFDLIVNDGPAFDLDRVIIRSAYLVVMSAMLAYVSAVRERAQMRLTRVASPPDLSHGAAPYSLEPLLKHAARLVGAAQVVVGWEEENQPLMHWASWRGGVYSETPSLRGALALVRSWTDEAPETGRGPASEAQRHDHVWQGIRAMPELDEFERETSHLVRVPFVFEGQLCKGAVFFFGREKRVEDAWNLAEIIVAQIERELDRQAYRTEAAVTAALNERMRLGRDIHDSVLQSLAAANLQLKVLEKQHDESGAEKLGVVRASLTEVQQRIRGLVESASDRADPAQAVAIKDRLSQIAEKMARQWDCSVDVEVSPQDAVVSGSLGEQLVMLFSEGISNSVRHGQAKKVSLQVTVEPEQVRVELRDDGRGFQTGEGELFREGTLGFSGKAPSSLYGRITDLGGSLGLSSSGEGTYLRMQVPNQ